MNTTSTAFESLPCDILMTTLGPKPVSELRYIPQWFCDGVQVQFVETYFFGEQLVRRNVHTTYLNAQPGS